MDVLSTPMNVDQTYMNVGWGGVRTSSLPYALEAGNYSNSDNVTTRTKLKYENVNDVDYLDLCKFGEVQMGRAAILDLKRLGGYTTFVDGRLLVNQTLPAISLPCRKPIGSGGNCTSNPSTCMVGSCDRADVLNRGYVRMKLRVKARTHPQCVSYEEKWNDLVMLKCQFHDVGFGHTFPTPESLIPSCAPWAEAGLFNRVTGTGVNIAYLRHWSYLPKDGLMHFAVYSTNKTEAVSIVNSIFDNTRRGNDLAVDILPVRRVLPRGSIRTRPMKLPLDEVPSDYDPSSLYTFTFVYGDGSSVPDDGDARRRVGSTQVGTKTRDFTVFTVNWFGTSIRLSPGSTYVNRGYYFISDLGSVDSTAGALLDKVHAARIDPEDWSPRTVDIYRDGTKFVALAASSSGGTSTNCSSPSAALVCSGTSTPSPGHVPFFYVTCGESRTYLGPDPYHFAPPFGSRFPGHGNITNIVRSYVCDGEDSSVRPTWKLMGFYNSTDADCASLRTATYDGGICPANNTASASSSPTATPTEEKLDPTNAASPSPTATPTRREKLSKAKSSKSPSRKSKRRKSNLDPTRRPSNGPRMRSRKHKTANRPIRE
jgi:hypothetical protein